MKDLQIKISHLTCTSLLCIFCITPAEFTQAANSNQRSSNSPSATSSSCEYAAKSLTQELRINEVAHTDISQSERYLALQKDKRLENMDTSRLLKSGRNARNSGLRWDDVYRVMRSRCDKNVASINPKRQM